MKNGLKSLSKSVLIPFGLTATTSTADAATQKTFYGSGMTTLIISNKEMKYVL